MRACLLFLFSLLLSGCTRVVFTATVGQPVSAADADCFKGEWIGEKSNLWRVDREPASGQLVAHWTEDGKEQSSRLDFTLLGDHVAIVWVEEKELGGYMPLRISGAEDAVALLLPNEDEVKRLVAEGKLSGTFNKEKNYWLVAKGDWAAVLESPAFWDIDKCLPFVRPPVAPSTAATKPAPPVAPPPPSPAAASHPS